MGFSHGSRNRLTARACALFPGESLFDRLARAVCEAECLPRKELFEAWEVARRVRRHFRGGRVVDLACGHGLLGWALLLLDDSSPRALCVDARRPASAERLRAVLEARWPRLAGRVEFQERSLCELQLEPGDLVVSAHACGELTDKVLALAIAARARVAVLPCCHGLGGGEDEDAAGLEGWLDRALAIDVTRACRLRAAGYRVWTARVPEEVTPKNRLLLGEPL
jgi:hypothetical protein